LLNLCSSHRREPKPPASLRGGCCERELRGQEHVLAKMTGDGFEPHRMSRRRMTMVKRFAITARPGHRIDAVMEEEAAGSAEADDAFGQIGRT